MASREQMSASIEPGSLAYGDRAPLEEGLAAVGAAGPGGPAGAPGLAPTPNVAPVGGSPLDLMLSGDFPADPSRPLTDGLGVGPGSMPAEEATAPPLVERLRIIATQAKTPSLRAEARTALKLLQERGVI